MRISFRRISEGERIPWWGAIAWWDYDRNMAVVMPVGLHWVASAFRDLWYLCKRPMPSWIDKAIHESNKDHFNRGFDLGRTVGFSECLVMAGESQKEQK